jgi:hypothetical protein
MNEEDPILTAVGAIVNDGKLAGAATLVWRAGKVIQAAGVGWRETLALMTSNRLTEGQRASSKLPGMPIFAAGHGCRSGVTD